MISKPSDIAFYASVARRAAHRSHAERSKVGAVVVNDDHVMAVGYNGTPSGWDNCCELSHDIDGINRVMTKPEVIHAELNALFKFIRSGLSAKNTTMFITLSPCIECAKAIHLAGVSKVYYMEEYRLTDGIDFLKKSDVQIEKLMLDDASS